MNVQNPSKKSTALKENHVAEQHECSQNGDQKRGSVFSLITKRTVWDLQVHFLPGTVSCVGAFTTHQNGRLLLVNEFWGSSGSEDEILLFVHTFYHHAHKQRSAST